MSGAQEFLTTASIYTFTGATIGVWAASNTLRLAFRRDWPWIPLAVSIAVSFSLAANAGLLIGLVGYLVAVLNACLLFLAAAGLQQASAADVTGSEGGRRHGRQRVRWLTPWLRGRAPSEPDMEPVD